MKIAVLMSTCNGHRYLGQQLESLANQTVADNITVYIRDDGSTDNTFNIIEKWRQKVNIVLYKGRCNIGPAMSFWKLLISSQIQADYYAFCDQDDVWDSDKLEVAIEHLQGNTHFYACNCRIIDEKGIITNELRLTKAPQINVESLFISGCTQGCSMVFTDVLRKYIIEKKIQTIPMHDIVVMLYAMQFGAIYWDQTPHFGYRVHSNNVVAKNNKSKIQQIKTIIWNWKNSSKNSMSKVAAEMLTNISDFPLKDRQFLEYIADYKKHRIWLIKNIKKYTLKTASVRSYIIRILIGLY